MKNSIELTGLTKRYKTFTLGPLDLRLPTGYIMGFIGENGAGKSTVIKSMLGLITPDGGTIRLLGKELRDRSVMDDVGMVLDSGCFPTEMSLHALDGVLRHVYKNWDSDLYSQLLKRFQLGEKKKVKSLSRGMTMKLSLAAALAHHPKLLLLDEATSGLDPVVRDDILDLLLDFMQNEEHSIFLSSHITTDLEKIADYIVFLHRGKIVMSGEKDLLLDSYGILKCAEEELSSLDSSAVAGVRTSPYGVTALVERQRIPKEFTVEPATLDDIMLYSIKGEKAGKEIGQ